MSKPNKKQPPQPIRTAKPAATPSTKLSPAAPQETRKTNGVAQNSTSPTSGLIDRFGIWALLFLTFLVLKPMLKFTFLNWDDEVNIQDNPNLRAFDWESIKGIFTSDVIGNYNPLTIFVFALQKHFFGLDKANAFMGLSSAGAFHLVNLLLHLGVVYMVYRCLRALNLNGLWALAVAALFSLHPMRIESIAWVTELKDVLFAFFYFFALWQYIELKSKNTKIGWRTVLILGAFVLALLSKIQAVCLPLSMLCIDYLLRRPLKRSLLLEKIPYFLLSIGFGVLGIYMLSDQKSLDAGALYNFGERLLIGGSSLGIYFIKWLVPYAMSPLYPYPKALEWYHYASPLVFLGMLAWGYWAYKNEKRNTLFGLAFFFFNVVFLLQIVGAGQGYWADRFTYVPYFGLFFLTVSALKHWSEQRPALQMPINIGFSVYLGILMLLSYKQNFVWSNPETLWTKAIAYETKSNLPFTNRAQYYRRTQRFDLAERDYKEAIRLKPEASIYNSVGKLFFDQKKPDPAIENYLNGIKLDSSMAEIWVNLGAAYGMKEQYETAKQYLNKGLALDSLQLNGRLNRGLVRFMTGDYQGAMEDNLAYLRQNPYKWELYYEVGLDLINLKRPQEAIPYFDKAIAGKPDLAVSYLMRATAYRQLGQIDKSRTDAQKAKQLGLQNIDPALFQ